MFVVTPSFGSFTTTFVIVESPVFDTTNRYVTAVPFVPRTSSTPLTVFSMFSPGAMSLTSLGSLSLTVPPTGSLPVATALFTRSPLITPATVTVTT